MRTAGIICEYNPFHLGHRYQLQEVRRILGEETGVVCLMSGNYVQRGEPAIYDKWVRAASAVENGADLVLELPMTMAVNAAGYFASGAVDCMDGLGGIDCLCFGSEGKSTEILRQTAEVMGTEAYEEALRRELEGGVSYAKARELALGSLGADSGCLAAPNSALGVDYLRRLLERGSSIRPLAIAREEALPSASELRARLTAAGPDAGAVPSCLPGRPMHTLSYGERAMLAVLKTLPGEAFAAMPFGSEGLWSKVMKASRREATLEDIIFACKSKRYTFSRLRRMLLCLFLGLSQADMNREIPYLRVLAFNDRGRELLRGMKETSRYPLVSGAVPSAPEAQEYFALESRATDLYGLFAQPGVTEPAGREIWHIPAYVREEAHKGAAD